jgi:ABC-type methionine transport system ATPase subunit
MSGGRSEQPAGGSRRLIHCTLPSELVQQPVLHGLVQATDAVVNVRRANVDVEAGVAWYILELSGPDDELDRAEAWLRGIGVTVEPIEPAGPAPEA